MITKVLRGDPFPDIPHLGDLLPVGAQVSHGPTTRDLYVQELPRTWTLRGAHLDPYVYSSPLYLRDEIEVTIPPESAEMFRWRLRDTALAAAERSGVAIPPVHEMACEFGAHDPLFLPGGVISNGWDIKALPVGTIVYQGHPDKPALLDVWEADGTKQMVHVMGPRNVRTNGQPVTIHSIPGVSQVPEFPVADDAALCRIALRAWRVGKSFKTRQSWCSVFENCLLALGITEKSVAGAGGTHFGPGDEVDRHQAARLDEGSLLFWSYRNHNAYSVYVRDDSARNIAKTRRVWGFHDTTDNSHERMVVAATPTEPMAWSAPGWAVRQMPAGTRYRRRQHEGTLVIGDDRLRVIDHWEHFSILGFPT